MTLREEFENEIKNKKDIERLFETSNKKYIEWLEVRINNLGKDLIIEDDTPITCPNCGSIEQMAFFDYYKCGGCSMRHDGKEEA